MAALERENTVVSGLIEISYAEKGLLSHVIEEVDIGELIESTAEDLKPKSEAFQIEISKSIENGF